MVIYKCISTKYILREATKSKEGVRMIFFSKVTLKLEKNLISSFDIFYRSIIYHSFSF